MAIVADLKKQVREIQAKIDLQEKRDNAVNELVNVHVFQILAGESETFTLDSSLRELVEVLGAQYDEKERKKKERARRSADTRRKNKERRLREAELAAKDGLAEIDEDVVAVDATDTQDDSES